jgi:hypothetical protein
MVKLKIVRLDKDGYNGRDFYAMDSDKGTVVHALRMETHMYESGTPTVDKNGRVSDEVDLLMNDIDEQMEIMWTCLTDDGRTVQMMDHEVEVVK